MAAPTFLIRTPEPAPAGRGLREIVASRPLTALGPPVALFLLLRLAFALVTPTTITDLDPSTWARFDSGNYTSIATEGYYFESCEAHGTPEMGELCSNAAWYPGYPYAAAGVSAFGLSFATAAIVISHTAALGILVMVWAGFLGAQVTRKNVLLLVLAGAFPGGVYLFGMFPLSLMVLLILVQIWLFQRRQWMTGATVGALAGLIYPITFVLAPASAVWMWLATSDRPVRARLRAAALVGGVVAVGNLAVFALHQIWLGHWDASLIHQREAFDSELRNPAVNLWNVVVDRDSWMQVNAEGVGGLLAAQTLLVLMIVATTVVLAWRAVADRVDDGRLRPSGPGALATTARGGLRSRVTYLGRADADLADLVGLTLLVVALWILPLMNTIDTGLYRREVAVLPAVILLRRAPAWLVAGFVVVAVPIWALLAQKFYWHVVI